jgi:hypothetical protein
MIAGRPAEIGEVADEIADIRLRDRGFVPVDRRDSPGFAGAAVAGFRRRQDGCSSFMIG